MKKSYKIILGCFVAVLCIYSLYLALNGKPKNNNPGTSSDTITIPVPGGELKTNNFIKQPVQQSGNNMEIAETPQYSIVYFAKDQAFLITIAAEPVQNNRDLAEQAFLDKLKISFTDACKLKVSLSVPAEVNAKLSGTDYGLSFCPQGLHF